MLNLLFMGSALAATGPDLASSMDVPSGDVVSADAGGMSIASAVLTDLGTLLPQSGSDFVYLYTGQVGVAPQSGTDLGSGGTTDDLTSLTLELDVPLGMYSLSFQFFFLSAEYPEWVSSGFNDAFEANVTGSAYTGNAAIDTLGNVISVDSALFSVTDYADLVGTGFENDVGGGTGWLTIAIPVTPGEHVTIDLSVYDVSDGVYDSSVALDDFEWSGTDIDVPTIIEEIDLNYLSPKRGTINGGSLTELYGNRFSEGCDAYFDGVIANTTYVDTNTLEVFPPAHDPGLVDVEVQCIGSSELLVGGYTYYDEESGEIPPVVTGVDPYDVEVDGGTEITVTGEDFASGMVVELDGETVTTTWISAQEFRFEAPAHDPALVDLRITNPDGLEDIRAGAILYIDRPYVEGEGDSSISETGQPVGEGNCSTGPTSSSFFAFLAFGLLLRRRQ